MTPFIKLSSSYPVRIQPPDPEVLWEDWVSQSGADPGGAEANLGGILTGEPANLAVLSRGGEDATP